LGASLLAILIYALMHPGAGIMTLVLLATVLLVILLDPTSPQQQRIFLFFLILLNFAEYFYLLPPTLRRYQQEDWWHVPTIQKALLTMSIFWSIAWMSAVVGNFLDSRERKKLLEREKRKVMQQPATSSIEKS